MSELTIRLINEKDDAKIASIIRESLLEFDAPEAGSALGDAELDYMTKAFSEEKSAYFIAEEDGKILGGAGIASLDTSDEETCELRKMYLSQNSRGKGIGAALMQACLNQAQFFGYKFCYIETFPSMRDAQKLYVKAGFYYLNSSKGSTGHTACTVWLQKELSDGN
ncbi:MAG: GNAT family N-acetyltransferase [Flavobacterium sp.]|nr:MAG: GNAT family N-acetyltransferase [Flavobacterium sp.]